jgi:hypothetical protein
MEKIAKILTGKDNNVIKAFIVTGLVFLWRSILDIDIAALEMVLFGGGKRFFEEKMLTEEKKVEKKVEKIGFGG